MGGLTTPTGALRAWVSLALTLVSVAALAFLTIAYVAGQQRKICGIVVLLDDRNRTLPEGDADTMRFRAELHRYRVNLGC